MATIKAGTYRFNDVLSAPSADLEQSISFTTTPAFTFDEGTMSMVSLDGVMNWATIVVANDFAGFPVIVNFCDTYDNPSTVYARDNGDWSFLADFCAENGFSNTEVLNGCCQTITIPTDQEVSTEFAEWFSANAAPVAEHTVSGVWKFKDVLTQGGVNGAYANIDFTVTCDLNIPAMPAYGFGGYSGTHIFTCTCISQEPNETGVGSVSFDFETAEPALPDSLAALGISVPSTKYVYQANAAPNGWDDYASMMGEGIKTIDFGTEPQTVSAEFYNWLTANATQPMASITHNGETIASLFPGQTATLKCAGMKMADDVVVSVAELPEAQAVVMQTSYR